MTLTGFQPIYAPKGTAHRKKRASSPQKDKQSSRKRRKTAARHTSPVDDVEEDKKSGFDILPTELFAQIFGYVLTKDYPIRYNLLPPKKTKRFLGFNLLRVNKLFYEQAGAVAYGTNVFQVNGVERLASFLDRIGRMRTLAKRFDWSGIPTDGNELIRYRAGKFRIFDYFETDLKAIKSITVNHDDICGCLTYDLWREIADCHVKYWHNTYETFGFLRFIYSASKEAKEQEGSVELFTAQEGKPNRTHTDNLTRWCCMHLAHEERPSCHVTQQHCNRAAAELNAFCATGLGTLYSISWKQLCKKFPLLTQNWW